MKSGRWTFYDLSAWRDHAAAWESLNRLQADSPALDPDFIEPFFAELATGTERLAVCDGNDGPIAMTLVQDGGRGYVGTMWPDQALLGFWVQRPEYATVGLAAGLISALPLSKIIFSLSLQDPDIAPRPKDTSRITTVDYVPTARIAMSGSFDDYWKARSKKLRENLRRASNGLIRNERPPRLVELNRPEDIARGIREYGEIESAGWKAEIDGAIHGDNAQGRYYTEMMTRLAAKGNASVFQFYYGDKLVASDLCIYRGGTIIGLKTTYDEAEKSTSPALLMRQEMMRDFLDHQRFSKYEFYGRVRDWQTKWSNDFRVMYHINVYRWSVLKAIHARMASHEEAKIGGSARQDELAKNAR